MVHMVAARQWRARGYPLARHFPAATMLTFHSWGEDVVDITQQVVWCNVHNILAPAVKC